MHQTIPVRSFEKPLVPFKISIVSGVLLLLEWYHLLESVLVFWNAGIRFNSRLVPNWDWVVDMLRIIFSILVFYWQMIFFPHIHALISIAREIMINCGLCTKLIINHLIQIIRTTIRWLETITDGTRTFIGVRKFFIRKFTVKMVLKYQCSKYCTEQRDKLSQSASIVDIPMTCFGKWILCVPFTFFRTLRLLFFTFFFILWVGFGMPID